MNAEFKVIILAIFDDSDFANKAMTDINGKPMIQHVFESAREAGASEIVIATDNTRVGMNAEDFGAMVCMIVDDDLKGLNRMAEVVDKMDWSDDTIVVTLPGDAPLMPGTLIKQVAENLIEQTDAECSALYSLVSHDIVVKESTVASIVDIKGNVMYLSRNPVPHHITDEILSAEYKCIIDIYAYRACLLRIYRDLPSSKLDRAENIDELRILFNGIKMHAAEASKKIGQRVIKLEDVEKVKDKISPNH